MTATPNKQPGHIADKGGRLEFQGKSIRVLNDGKFVVRTPQIFEHFFGQAIDATNGPLSTHSTGTTGADIPFAIVANGIGGTAQVATGTDANAGAVVSTQLNFNPSTQGTKKNIFVETRAKVVGTTTPADGDFYFGFGDATAYASDLPYVIGAAGTTTTGVPTEGAFIGYTSVTQTSGPVFSGTGDGTLFALTSKLGADTATSFVSSKGVAKDSAYHIFRVELNSDGDAFFFVDDVYRCKVASAITANTPLAAQLNIVTKASHVNTLTIDYIAVGGGLV